MAIQLKNEDPDLPTVLAVEGNRAFEFRCPFCRAPLKLHRIEYNQLVECPKEACLGEFQVATKRQIKQAEKREREYKKAIASEVARLRKGGEIPPDRISIFGVSSSGKSVFLAALYHLLWNGGPQLSARALHGDDHQHLLEDFASLSRGEWLAATTRTRAFDLSLRYRDVKVGLSSLDYPGEVFTDVFYRKRLDTPDRARLYNQIQTTMGAIILVDPEQVAESDSRLDVEFTGIEVAEHLQSRGMGEHIVVVLTKRNQNKRLVASHGGPEAFVAKFLPRLAEAAPDAPILHVSSVPTRIDDDFQRVPCVEGMDAAEVLAPLESLLEQIDPLYLELLQEIDREAISAAMALEAQARMEGQLDETSFNSPQGQASE